MIYVRSFTADAHTRGARGETHARTHQSVAGLWFLHAYVRADDEGGREGEREKRGEIKTSRQPNEKARGGAGPLIRRSAAAAGIPCTT